ncbi:MAG: ATP-binding protein [Eubacteriales bacterium]|nr:ATP-binding protein [Eubacteriales bacterium]
MRKRIFISFIALILVFGTLSSLLVASIISTVIPGQVMNRLWAETALVMSRMETSGAEAAFENLISTSRVTHIAPDGTVLFDSTGIEDLDNHTGRKEVQAALNTGEGSAVRYSRTLRANLIYVATLLPDGSVLRLATSESASREMTGSMLPWQIFGTVAILILCLPLAAWLTSLLVKPILEIDLDSPDDSLVYEELMPLVRRIDEQARQNRQQLETLSDRRQELDALLGGMQEGFIAMDEDQRILLINGSACRMLGVDHSWALGKTVPEINRRREMLLLLSELKEKGCAQGMMARGGRSYILSTSTVPHGRGAVLLISDQTEKVEGEEMRKRFTANVSHELRTPLTTIFGYAEMLDKGMVMQEDIPAISGVILKESRRMLSLVEDILRLSRLDEGFPGGAHARVSLADTTSIACESLRPAARELGVTVNYEGEEAFVRGDRTLLGELCSNLIDNAIKYNQPGGSVRVRVEVKDRQAVLTVADTGIGIEPEHQPHIFERFYRTDKSRSKATGGTGLGLSIVKHAAEYHGARISLDSAPGRGTTISVAFPEPDNEGA